MLFRRGIAVAVSAVLASPICFDAITRRRAFAAIAMAGTVLSASPSHAQGDLNEAARIAYQRETAAAAQRGDLVTSGTDFDRMQVITQNLIAVAPEMRPDSATWVWDVAYIRSPQVNAHCLPGGKIVVFSGLVDRLSLTDDEVAAALGHEMGHALLDHGRESYVQHQVAQVGVGILGIIAAVVGARHHVDPSAAFNASTTVGSLGAEFLALRPYSRERELAADKYGAELAARAGYDSRAAISLQEKMAGLGSTIEFLSTHPASTTRVQELAQYVPSTAERFASRRRSGQDMPVVVATTNTEPPHVATADRVTSAASLSSVGDGQAKIVLRYPQAAAALLPSIPQQSAGSLVDPDAVTGAAAATMPSKYMFTAERYVRNQGCSAPLATMVTRAPTYESFAIKCANGSQLIARCESGTCAIRE